MCHKSNGKYYLMKTFDLYGKNQEDDGYGPAITYKTYEMPIKNSLYKTYENEAKQHKPASCHADPPVAPSRGQCRQLFRQNTAVPRLWYVYFK